MSLIRTSLGVEYPESDGQPMGETDLHRDWMVRILELLRQRYRNQRVYVACDLLLYYEEGEPTKFVVPDNFVVLDSDPGRRRTYKLWEEGKAPNTVFEVTSRSTRKNDSFIKPRIYEAIGVKEYFLYDPTEDYLQPTLQGFRLSGNGYVPIEANPRGRLVSRELQMELQIRTGELVMFDASTDDVLLTAEEASEAARTSAEMVRDEAMRRADRAEVRAAELEAELRRLKEERP